MVLHSLCLRRKSPRHLSNLADTNVHRAGMDPQHLMEPRQGRACQSETVFPLPTQALNQWPSDLHSQQHCQHLQNSSVHSSTFVGLRLLHPARQIHPRPILHLAACPCRTSAHLGRQVPTLLSTFEHRAVHTNQKKRQQHAVPGRGHAIAASSLPSRKLQPTTTQD